MTESLETGDTAASAQPADGKQEEEQTVPTEQNADYLHDDGLDLSDHTSDQCFDVERRIVGQPTYSMPAVARLHLLAEVIGNPSGLLDCQWKISDVVAESVNALEQRLLQVTDSTDKDVSEDETDCTGACAPGCSIENSGELVPHQSSSSCCRGESGGSHQKCTCYHGVAGCSRSAVHLSCSCDGAYGPALAFPSR